jgi:hypothetical protein
MQYGKKEGPTQNHRVNTAMAGGMFAHVCSPLDAQTRLKWFREGGGVVFTAKFCTCQKNNYQI